MTGEKRREEKKYDYRHIDIDIEKQTHHFSMYNWKTQRFYVPEEFYYTLESLKQILHREGRNLSKWIREEAEHYVMLHEPGNPQQKLTTILKLGHPYRVETCARCGGKPYAKAVKSGIKLLLCKPHFEREKQRLEGWEVLSSAPFSKRGET